ncbi:uncharacterized protein LOC131927795 [Physella acuta]|uniref:uncharacterized protein LOC131927795 n=1 Tax=Physella acuta TaxID=109671 RepID=UPI0027DBD197|nr:uncharacterized protein LOC131927795 [Physella acuta]
MARRSKTECDKTDFDNNSVESHTDLLRKKCVQFDECIDQLYTQANGIIIGSTKDVNLKPLCSFLARSSNTSDNCKKDDKIEINKFLNHRMTSNNTFKLCWEGRAKTPFDNVCSDVQASSIVCKVNSTQRIAREFVNQELRNLECGCRQLNEIQKGGLPKSVLIGVGIGGFLILVIICLVSYICCKRNKSKKKKRQTMPNVIYVSNKEDPVYHEIRDDKIPPKLPSRNEDMLPGMKINCQQMEEHTYLDPVIKGMQYRVSRSMMRETSNPGMDSPPSYSQSERDAVENGDSGYFVPLPDTIDDQGRQLTAPVPAKRTKIPESPYFTLEEGNN